MHIRKLAFLFQYYLSILHYYQQLVPWQRLT